MHTWQKKYFTVDTYSVSIFDTIGPETQPPGIDLF